MDTAVRAIHFTELTAGNINKATVPNTLISPQATNGLCINKVIGAHTKLPEGRGKFSLYFQYRCTAVTFSAVNIPPVISI